MEISEAAFGKVAALFERGSGIRLRDDKRQMVAGRLNALAQEAGLASLDDYVERLVRETDPKEVERVVDRLTTNETYFFREPQHFDFLAQVASEHRGGHPFRVWSAASSSGEEAYTIAMVLSEHIRAGTWEVVGTDVSASMVAAARTALYPMERAKAVPVDLLRRFCLKGQGDYEGQLLVSRELRGKVRFEQGNLLQPGADSTPFDVIFLRNVLIYFDPPEKTRIVSNVTKRLRRGGYFITGHAETLRGISTGLKSVRASVYECAS